MMREYKVWQEKQDRISSDKLQANLLGLSIRMLGTLRQTLGLRQALLRKEAK
jgi:hypothetical protein